MSQTTWAIKDTFEIFWIIQLTYLAISINKLITSLDKFKSNTLTEYKIKILCYYIVSLVIFCTRTLFKDVVSVATSHFSNFWQNCLFSISLKFPFYWYRNWNNLFFLKSQIGKKKQVKIFKFFQYFSSQGFTSLRVIFSE